MNSTCNFTSSMAFPINTSPNGSFKSGIRFGFHSCGCISSVKISSQTRPRGSYPRAESCSARDMNKKRSSLESMFCYDKPIPEQIIDKPVGLSMTEREIGKFQRCTCCEAKGAVLCATCSGTGLYVDSIMESQGIIVKVRCLGCGGTGNIMCADCGGRGHRGHLAAA